MEAKKRDRRDLIQNLLIVVLTISAVLLFVITQSANLGLDWSPDRFAALPEGLTATTGETASLAGLSAPVHVAAGNSRTRFGLTYTTISDPALSHLATLMASALGSAGERTACSDEVFRAALGRISICFDFTTALPLPVLAALLGTELENTDFSARLMMLAPDAGNTVRLYLQDGDGKSYFSTPALYLSDLQSALERCEPNGAAFAFELGASYEALAPYTLLTDQVPACPLLAVSNSLTDKDTLLRQLGFNPHTTSRYPDAAGTETIVEISRTLRLQADGTVLYSSDGDPTVSVLSAEPLPTLLEAVTGTRQLAEQVLGTYLGEAQLYLTEVTQAAETSVVRFGLRQNGVTIRFADGAAAAEFTLTGNIVTAFSIRFRQYTATEKSSALLPLPQVVAIAPAGTRLTAAYVDDGSATLSASWLADSIENRR